MARFMLFAGAVALVLIQPIVALAAPAHAVYRPQPAPASRGSFGEQAPLKVPFDFKFHSASQEFNPQATLNPLRWRRWQWETLPPFLPYQSGCYATGMISPSWTPANLTGASAPPADFTIGSLVDNRSQKLFSSPTTYAQSLAASSTGAPETPGPLTFQYGMQPVQCGASQFFNF